MVNNYSIDSIVGDKMSYTENETAVYLDFYTITQSILNATTTEELETALSGFTSDANKMSKSI